MSIALDDFALARARARAKMQPRNDQTINELALLAVASPGDTVPIFHNGQTMQTPVSALSSPATLPFLAPVLGSDTITVLQNGVLYQALVSSIVAAQQGTLGLISVVTLGADPTGVADSTAAFNAGIAALNATQYATLYIPPGNYLLSGALSQLTASNCSIIGSGIGSCSLRPQQNTGDFLVVNGGSNLRFSGFLVDHPATRTSGATIKFIAANIVFCDNLYFFNNADAFTFGDAGTLQANCRWSSVHISNVLSSNSNAAVAGCGLNFIKGSGGPMYISACQFYGSNAGVTQAGINFPNGTTAIMDDFHVWDTIFEQFAAGMILNPGSGGSITDGFFTNVLWDALSVTGVQMRDVSGGNINRIKFSSCWIAGGASVGLALLDIGNGTTGTVKDIHWIGGNITGSGAGSAGVSIGSAAVDVLIDAAKIYDNSAVGMIVAAGATNIQVSNSKIGALYGSPGTLGLSVPYNLVNGNFYNNDCLNNVTPVAFTALAGTLNASRVKNCRGFNPVGVAAGAPAVPATGTAVPNPFPFDCSVSLVGGSATALSVTITGTAGATGAISIPNGGSMTFLVPAGASITPTFSTAPPTWVWVGV